MLWGFRAAGLNTTHELEYSGKVRAYSIIFLIVMLLSSAFAIWVMRRPRKERITRSYTVLLFIWTFLFFGIAVMVPKEGKAAQDMLYDECRNTSSPIHSVDSIYTTSNTVLCQPGCLCYAEKELWFNKTGAQSLIGEKLTDSAKDL